MLRLPASITTYVSCTLNNVAPYLINHSPFFYGQNVAISFGWVYEELAGLQRMLEPSRQIAIVKKYVADRSID